MATVTADLDPDERNPLVEKAEKRDRWLRRLPLLPALIFTIVVTQVPFLITLWYSLHKWVFNKPQEPMEFIGLSNFTELVSNEFFLDAALNTLWITGGTILFSVILGIIFAVLLDRKFLGQGIARTLLITPFLIMPVSASLVWRSGLFDAT